jgi:uncharacterized protein
MTRTQAQRIADIDRLYARLPRLDCVGRCVDSCTVIRMTRVERRRIAAAGVDIHPYVPARIKPVDVVPKVRCSALTMLGRCSVYEIRPAICRLWGMTRALQCTYGCVPEGGYMSEHDAYEWLAEVAEAAGEMTEAARFRRVAALPDLEQRVWQVRLS